MPSAPRGLPDWKDASAYAPLLEVERAGFAWEWLRRDGRYREAARDALAGRPDRGFRIEEAAALAWGLHAFEDPDLTAPAARPVWRAERHDLVLEAAGEASGASADTLALDRLTGLATIVRGRLAEHLLLSDGRRSVRLDVAGASLAAGAVRLHYRLSGFDAAERPLLALRRLLALQRSGSFSRALHPPETRARRFVAMLRAHDAVRAGATQREIAALLLSTEAARERWRVRAPTLRSRAQRLVRSAEAVAAGGYLSLL